MMSNLHESKVSKENGSTTGNLILGRKVKGRQSSFGGEKKDRMKSKITVGVCAMDKKARSTPMREILRRLPQSMFKIVIFGNDTILNTPIEQWPSCDCLIAFYSTGFPLDKAEAYVEKYQPISVNNLKMQRLLWDRRSVYETLAAHDIKVPRHIVVNRDGYGPSPESLIEHDDYIEVDGERIYKPFVEKPVDAEDHNIYIYYPMSAGGGSKRLFRKIGNRSSEFYPNDSTVRRDGSFIYEEFQETQGTDVKVYTVGPYYGHAEARKSPVVDGKVLRDANGKEVRFPVILSTQEKEIASKITMVLDQYVCGFDLLRVSKNESVVCDVNGWSFVKSNKKYYDSCAQLLGELMLAATDPGRVSAVSAIGPMLRLPRSMRTRNAISMTEGQRPNEIEDKTDFFSGRNAGKLDEGKRNKGSRVQLFLDKKASYPALHINEITPSPTTQQRKELLYCHSDTSSSANSPVMPPSPDSSHETFFDEAFVNQKERQTSMDSSTSNVDARPEELRCVLAVIRHGDRTPKQKLKMKVTHKQVLEFFHTYSLDPAKNLKVKTQASLKHFLQIVIEIISQFSNEEKLGDDDLKLFEKYKVIQDVLASKKILGITRKIQLKPLSFANEGKCTKLQIVVKWGGTLTDLGRAQAMRLGEQFRKHMYPDPTGGAGILQLHSTFRHDLKIRSSDEGRVMKTAAAFTQGLLELEGELTPIIVSLVLISHDSLDRSGNDAVKPEMDVCKARIQTLLQQDIDLTPEIILEKFPGAPQSVQKALKDLGNPRKSLLKIHGLIQELLKRLEEIAETKPKFVVYHEETIDMMLERWRKLDKELYNREDGTFDLTKVPDVHDNIRYDALHNVKNIKFNQLKQLYVSAKTFADAVVTQEYGATNEEKANIGTKICSQLIHKIKEDLLIACQGESAGDFRHMVDHSKTDDDNATSEMYGHSVRTRLYFTSESHLHGLMNSLLYSNIGEGCPVTPEARKIYSGIPELCYLTHVVIRLFEDMNKEEGDPSRFRIEIMFSPGADQDPFSARPSVVRRFAGDPHPTLKVAAPMPMVARSTTAFEINSLLQDALEKGKQPMLHKKVMSSPEFTFPGIVRQMSNFKSLRSLDTADICTFWKRTGSLRGCSNSTSQVGFSDLDQREDHPSQKHQNCETSQSIKRHSIMFSLFIICAAALIHFFITTPILYA